MSKVRGTEKENKERYDAWIRNKEFRDKAIVLLGKLAPNRADDTRFVKIFI